MHSAIAMHKRPMSALYVLIFFFNDTATTEIYTLSLHDALPIYQLEEKDHPDEGPDRQILQEALAQLGKIDVEHHEDRKSTRLNSSHANISYAVFCLKKKKISQTHLMPTST